MKMEKYLNRSSIKKFTGKKMIDKDVELLSKIINNSPTSENHQLFSAIIIRNQKTLDWISRKNWNQSHIKNAAAFVLFVADRYRLTKINENNNIKKNQKTIYFDSLKAIIDATIACAYTMNAAIEMGYGTSMVGGIQSYGDEINKKLNIPKNAYSILGLSIGEISVKNKFKPKVNKVFNEIYNKKKSYKDFIQYDKDTYKEFIKRKKNGIIEEINNASDPKKHFLESDPYVKCSKYLEKIIKNK